MQTLARVVFPGFCWKTAVQNARSIAEIERCRRVLVVQAGRTPHREIERAVNALGRERIFGFVLNRANAAANPKYAGYEYRYALPARQA